MDDGTRSTVKVLGAIALAVCVVGLGILWYFSDGQVAGRAHDEALARWESKEPAAYSFTYRYCGGMCADCPIQVTVRDGVVAEVTRGSDSCWGEPEGLTVEDLFDLESRARSGWFGDASTADYDPTWGFPSSISKTCAEGTSDCGGGWSISDFKVVAERD
jgi:hypothetical protein